jgi:hypothetical protein
VVPTPAFMQLNQAFGFSVISVLNCLVRGAHPCLHAAEPGFRLQLFHGPVHRQDQARLEQAREVLEQAKLGLEQAKEGLEQAKEGLEQAQY